MAHSVVYIKVLQYRDEGGDEPVQCEICLTADQFFDKIVKPRLEREYESLREVQDGKAEPRIPRQPD